MLAFIVFLPSILALLLALTLFFTLREPNIYKPHGFFWASSPLLFAFVLLFCFILLLFAFCYLHFVVNYLFDISVK